MRDGVKTVAPMGWGDLWRKLRRKPASKATLDAVLADLQEQEWVRKASRPEMTLPGGEKLFFEEDYAGSGSWTSETPVFSDAEGRQWSVVIDVDGVRNLPSEQQRGCLQQARDHLPDLLAKFEKRLPEECLEFDPETTEPPATFEELGGWVLWIEAPSTDEDYEWQVMCEMEEPSGSIGYAGKFVGLELVGIQPTY